MSIKSETERVVTATRQFLAPVPEVQKNLSQDLDVLLGSEHESGLEYIGRTFIDYYRVLRRMSALTERDIAVIGRAADLNNETNPSHRPDTLLHLLHDSDLLLSIRSLALEAIDTDSAIFIQTIVNLAHRMAGGSALYAEGAQPTDADSRFDDVIWGHTQGMQPRAMVHFVITHYLGRAFETVYSNYPNPDIQKAAHDKESFLGVIGATIRLMEAEGRAPGEIAAIWRTSRANGGVQWHVDKQNRDSGIDPKQRLYDQANQELHAESYFYFTANAA